MKTCHVCHQPWQEHRADCRIPADLDRMRKVYDRLCAEDREPQMRQRMGRYLGLFGHLPCQGRDGLPSDADCDTCGHKEVCVILPEAA